MNELVDIYINNEKHKAMLVNDFTIENRDFCIYAIPNGNGSFTIKCGKKLGNQVVDIEDENEKEVIDNIVKTILRGQKKEELFNMNDEEAKITINDNDGNPRNGYIMGKYEIMGNDYIVYSIEESEDESGIYIKKVIYNEAGEEESLESITDPEERDLVFAAVRTYINSEMGEE